MRAGEKRTEDAVQGEETFHPEKCPLDLLLAGCVAVFALLWSLQFFRVVLYVDEGISLQGAVRILQGELPYRDFFSFYTPGSFYFYAALFRVFGQSLAVARSVLLVYAALFSSITYLLARRTSTRQTAFFAAVLVSIVCLPARFAALHNWDSTATCLVALYAAVLSLEYRKPLFVFLCCFFASTTLMIEQSKGAGLFLGLAIATLVIFVASPTSARQLPWKSGLLGAVLPVAAVTAFFGAHRALLSMLAGCLWPFRHYSVVNRLPYGFVSWMDLGTHSDLPSVLERVILALTVCAPFMLALLPLLLVLLGAVVCKRLLKDENDSEILHYAVLVTGVVAGTLLATIATGRPDFFHLAAIAPLFLFAMPLLLDERVVPVQFLKRLTPILAIFIATAFLLCGLLLRELATSSKFMITTRRGTVRESSPDELERYVEAHIARDQKLLVYPYNPLLTFLTETRNPTRFDFLQPGMHSAEQYAAAQQQLQKDRTEAVLFDITFREMMVKAWPSTPARFVAEDAMGDYIFNQYRVCRVLRSGRNQPFAYMVRKDLPCPVG